jgi:NodT family efflux transporter outer membrane factor (OMF) lipoprotein
MPYEKQLGFMETPCVQSDSPLFVEGQWPGECWWTVFESDELDEFMARAIENNPTLAAAEFRVEQAYQEARLARSRFFPLIFFNAIDTYEYLSENGLYRAFNPLIPLSANVIDLTLSAWYEFDFWGKNQNLFYAALGERAAQAAEEAQTQLTITTAVAQAYFALKTNLMRQSLYEALQEVASETYDLTNRLHGSALFSRLDMLSAWEKLYRAQQAVSSIRQEVATNRHLLNILMGVGPDECLVVGDSLPRLPQRLALPCDLTLSLVGRRPDLTAQVWRTRALAYQVGAAMAAYYPDVSLRAFIGLESVIANRLFDLDSGTVGATPVISLPIFTGGAIRANIRSKTAEYDEAVATYNELLLRSVQEVTDLMVLAESIWNQRQQQQQIVEASQGRFGLTQLRHGSGLDSAFDYLSFREALLQRQLEDIGLLYSQYITAIKLIKALGGGFDAS